MAADARPALSLEHITVRFGGLTAVDDVDLDVAAGRIVAVIGPNGAGKSTLLRTIAGLHRADVGRVLVDGADVTGLPVHAVRQRGVATVLQTPRPLTSMSVRDNAALGAMFGSTGGRRARRAALAEADEALDLVGLGPRAADDVERLTLHDRRLLDLARALAGRPRLLLLDEVMAGLTESELEDAMTVVRSVRDEAGVTVVWVEHVMSAVRALADRVAVLDAGRLLAAGPPDEVMASAEVVRAYLGDPAPPAPGGDGC